MTKRRSDPKPTLWCMIADGRGFTEVEATDAEQARKRFAKTNRAQDWMDTGKPLPPITVATLAEAMKWAVQKS